MSRTIVVGGYGHVGRRLAARLAGSRPVVVAGRRTTPAAEVAAALDVEAAAVPVDARTGAGLDEVARPGDLVINAAGDDPKARLLRRSIALGCHYTDLTADRATIQAMLALDATARASEVSAVVGIGLAPGATNLLARAVVDDLGGADRVDIGILLSLADGFGPAALDWTLATLGSRTVDAFRDRTTLAFGPLGTYPAYSFGFPEQYFLPSTLAVTEARGWFGLRPAIAGRTVNALARSSTLRAALARPTARTAIARLAGKLPRTPTRRPGWGDGGRPPRRPNGEPHVDRPVRIGNDSPLRGGAHRLLAPDPRRRPPPGDGHPAAALPRRAGRSGRRDHRELCARRCPGLRKQPRVTREFVELRVAPRA